MKFRHKLTYGMGNFANPLLRQVYNNRIMRSAL